MFCFSPEKKKHSDLKKKAWNGLIFSLQKKLTCFGKPRLNGTRHYHHHHHHHHHYVHYGHLHQFHGHQSQLGQRYCLERSSRYMDIVYKDILPIEGGVPKDTVTGKIRNDPDDEHDHDDDHPEKDDTGDGQNALENEEEGKSPVGVRLQGVDARAQEFIEKMKGSWLLERQISEEKYVEIWTRPHED